MSHQIDITGLLIKLMYFTVLRSPLFGYVDTFLGSVVGWMGGLVEQNQISAQLKLKLGIELGNNRRARDESNNCILLNSR